MAQRCVSVRDIFSISAPISNSVNRLSTIYKCGDQTSGNYQNKCSLIIEG